MANAAAATQALIERSHPVGVLNYGCAGAHRADLQIGDIVVGTRAVAYLEPGAPTVECDPNLVALAAQVDFPRAHFGTVASGDAGNRSPETIEALSAKHNSLCEDMEAAAIGLVCQKYGIPFLTVKDISNNELVRGTTSWEAVLAETGPDQLAQMAASFTMRVIQAYAMSRR